MSRGVKTGSSISGPSARPTWFYKLEQLTVGTAAVVNDSAPARVDRYSELEKTILGEGFVAPA